MRREAPKFPVVTKLVARALGITPDVLQDSFRVAASTDLPAILELRRSAYGASLTWDDDRYVRWRYGVDGSSSFGKMFILTIRSRLVGIIGAECISLVRGERRCDAMSLMDVLVDSTLEDTGLGVWLNMAMFERHSLVVEIGANENSIGTINRLYHRLPNRICYSYPLHLYEYLRRRMNGSSFATVLAVPLNFVLSAARLVTFPSSGGRWQFKAIDRFEEDLAAVFRDRHGAEICIERSSRWLNWRLFDNPRTRFHVIGAYADDKLEGYIAFYRRAESSAAAAVEIADWCVVKRYGMKLTRRLVGEVVQHAIAGKAAFVRATILGDAMGRMLKSFGFIATTNEYLTVGFHVAQQKDWSDLHEGSHWFISDSNTDTDQG